MKLTVDPLPMAKQQKKDAVNANANISATPHIDAAYALKREYAKNDPSKLQAEADLRGITVDELADLILSKGDLVWERELVRQQIMKRIDDATTLEELRAI